MHERRRQRRFGQQPRRQRRLRSSATHGHSTARRADGGGSCESGSSRGGAARHLQSKHANAGDYLHGGCTGVNEVVAVVEVVALLNRGGVGVAAPLKLGGALGAAAAPGTVLCGLCSRPALEASLSRRRATSVASRSDKCRCEDANHHAHQEQNNPLNVGEGGGTGVPRIQCVRRGYARDGGQ